MGYNITLNISNAKFQVVNMVNNFSITGKITSYYNDPNTFKKVTMEYTVTKVDSFPNPSNDKLFKKSVKTLQKLIKKETEDYFINQILTLYPESKINILYDEKGKNKEKKK